MLLRLNIVKYYREREFRMDNGNFAAQLYGVHANSRSNFVMFTI
jgi:hypothetical protein